MNILFEISDNLLIGILVFFLLVIVIVFSVIKFKNRKIKPIDDDDRYDRDEFPTISVKEISKEELTDEQLEAKKELQRVYDMMSKDLEKQNKASDEIEEFEREQEESAIISYQELIKQADKLKKDADMYERRSEEAADTELVSAMDNFSRKTKVVRKSSSINKPETRYSNSSSRRFNEVRNHKSQFKSSDIISPIYGVQNNKKMMRKKTVSKRGNDDIISRAYESNDFDNEKTQNLDFLNSLKKFRKNL